MSTLDLSRREMMQALGAGLMIAVAGDVVIAQAPPDQRRRGGGGRGAGNLAARLHVGADGVITVMTGKVEGGQGARAQITQAAAEELRVSPDVIRLIMGDTELCPDDGPTVGSRTTPSTVPNIRKAAAAARQVLVDLAAKRLETEAKALTIAEGKITHNGRSVTYGQLVGEDLKQAFTAPLPDGVQVSDVKEWKVLGQPLTRPNGRDIVTGADQFPSDIRRPGMLYGAILRAPGMGQTLESLEDSAAKDVQLVRDGKFVGVVAGTSYAARKAIAALAATAKWAATPQPSSSTLYEHLAKTAKDQDALDNPYAEEQSKAPKSLAAEYRVAYVQHAPLEPRAAVAEWAEGKLTVWTATQNPHRVRGELQEAFNLQPASVRVIVPDFGGGFGGKHTGECAVEAARLAKAAGKPVSLRWTREEEFTWASFRPAALIKAAAALDGEGGIASWYFVNVNSGGSGLKSPYRCAVKQEQYVESTAPPLRHGSYRGLAATANHFAREVFIDELAAAASLDPLAFRLKNLDDERLRAVLKAATDAFDWAGRSKDPKSAIGLACGVEKGSYVANCCEVAVDGKDIRVKSVSLAYECGKIQNPLGLMAQVKGGVLQGLGPALWEEILLDHGKVTNPHFAGYRVPRFADVPTLDVQLLDRIDLPSAGAGETPIVAIAPAIANAVARVTGQRVRSMPIRLA